MFRVRDERRVRRGDVSLVARRVLGDGGGSGPLLVADSNANPHPVAFDVGDDGALVLELFEGYDDRNAASGDADDAADATWEGNLTVAYRTRLGVGYDFRDAASTRCAGAECAVEDDHEVVFPVARDDTETFYVGVHNARVGTPGGTLGPRERARFDAPMTTRFAPSRRPKTRPRVFERVEDEACASSGRHRRARATTDSSACRAEYIPRDARSRSTTTETTSGRGFSTRVGSRITRWTFHATRGRSR